MIEAAPVPAKVPWLTVALSVSVFELSAATILVTLAFVEVAFTIPFTPVLVSTVPTLSAVLVIVTPRLSILISAPFAKAPTYWPPLLAFTNFVPRVFTPYSQVSPTFGSIPVATTLLVSVVDVLVVVDGAYALSVNAKSASTQYKSAFAVVLSAIFNTTS